MQSKKEQDKWQFWVDRGGTFTDIVALRPDGRWLEHKLLSEDPEHYQDAAVAGMKVLMGLDNSEALDSQKIASVKMGTTLVTNALLERKGESVGFCVTQGFADLLVIGDQTRDDLFALEIKKPQPVYKQVIEVEERLGANGQVVLNLNEEKLINQLKKLREQGISTLAVALLHSYQYPEHELRVGRIAENLGFNNVVLSHQVAGLIKILPRAQTAVVDAYLSPLLKNYIKQLKNEIAGVDLKFMQSGGGLVSADNFHAKDAILSGPAGGVVGAVKSCEVINASQLISFDMGGTSTDVAHYAGEYERTNTAHIARTQLFVPMMDIHTVAAGGGSICQFDGQRFKVGPESAGANPGPACYRKNGPLTVTDCNVLLGRVQADFFPKVFGVDANQSLDRDIVVKKFKALQDQLLEQGINKSSEEIAEGFLEIAIDNMARAVKKVSVERGHDIARYTLCSFGGAGGQHACQIAKALDISQVIIPPFAGVLSAVGIGLANQSMLRTQTVNLKLTDFIDQNKKHFDSLLDEVNRECSFKKDESVVWFYRLGLRYQGSEAVHWLDLAHPDVMEKEFLLLHKRYYGFAQDKEIEVAELGVEIIAKNQVVLPGCDDVTSQVLSDEKKVKIYISGQWQERVVLQLNEICFDKKVTGPALIIDKTNTIFVDKGWCYSRVSSGHLILEKLAKKEKKRVLTGSVDPVQLEIFNNRFMSIAEQMGSVLKHTAQSVNIKERLDFSCALFDQSGNLVANAPHMPVHLGAMGVSVRAIAERFQTKMKQGDVFILNSPYHGGSHLPDITIITPVFSDKNQPVFYIANRGHHADIGGISPGSMPAESRSIFEEGIFIRGERIVDQGVFLEEEVRNKLLSGDYPCRLVDQNIADLKAQVAANQYGLKLLEAAINEYSETILAEYMRYIQRYSANKVLEKLSLQQPSVFETLLDDGAVIKVKIKPEKNHIIIDFSGTSDQRMTNMNAPEAVCRSAVLYVMRLFVNEDIPLNEGFFKTYPINSAKKELIITRIPSSRCCWKC
ncbi:hydantoinase B/oxoprolinase family protein [Piscirickettsia litoralis]|uniref:hydantoinase B/oxoprolinase family protein n=1 Tax=Piscirickettsia litoralis TaxID=1891921 RepID=UPI000B0C4D0C|nr:hydantoinase B/oxoprolinase family protein [Piscirickettsia litoralis]